MSETTQTKKLRLVRACELRLTADQAQPYRKGDVFEVGLALAEQLLEQGLVVEASATDAKPKRKRSAT